MSGLVFFSGGSALANLSRYMAKTNFYSTHLITTFDNGGSSAELRHSFAMPAVGDLRNRLLALASPGVSPELIRLLSFRIPKTPARNYPADFFIKILYSILSPNSKVWQDISVSKAIIVREALQVFLSQMPANFNLANASIGNLVITGLFLSNNRNLGKSIEIFSQLLEIIGYVLPVSESNLQLTAILQNGEVIYGQECFKNILLPIKKIFLTVHENFNNFNEELKKIECSPPVPASVKFALENADIICYPPGSFYSSILVNLLLKDVANSIAASRASKVFIPNSGFDPENSNLGIAEQAVQIIKILQKERPESNPRDFIHYILLDRKNGRYNKDDLKAARNLEKFGIKFIDKSIISPHDPSLHLPENTLNSLMELAK